MTHQTTTEASETTPLPPLAVAAPPPARRKPRQQLGSLEWAQRTNGLMTTPRERLALASQVARYVVEQAQRRIASARGRRPQAEFDMGRLPFPRTEAARSAEELIEEQMTPVWVNHSYRTYVYAYVLGRYDGLDFDEEVLYVSSLMHDLSLADSNIAVQQKCFSLSAAETADELVDGAGWAAERRELLGDTLTRHINLWIPVNEAPEAYLLHVGTKLDVVGLRYSDLSPILLADILDRYPRLAFKDTFRPKMRAHAGAVPTGRAGWYARRIQSDRRRGQAPFPD